MFNDISCDRYDNKDECLKNTEFVKTSAKRFGIGQWSFIGPGSERKWYPSGNSPQGASDHVAEDMLLKFEGSGHPIFRSATPLSRGKLKSKKKGRCPYTSVLIKIQLIQFVALCFLSINSASTEQWQLYAMNMKATQTARSNPLYWWVNQLFLEKSKQKLIFMMNPETTKSFYSNMFNKLNRFHQKTEWINSVRKQDLCVLSKLDNISWQEMLVNFSKQWLVANTPFHEMTKLLNQKGGSEETRELDLSWKSRQAFQHFKYGIEVRIESVNKDKSHSWVRPVERSNAWSILLKTIQKILQIHKKRKVYQQAQVWLQPGQKQKQNLNLGNTLARQLYH